MARHDVVGTWIENMAMLGTESPSGAVCHTMVSHVFSCGFWYGVRGLGHRRRRQRLEGAEGHRAPHRQAEGAAGAASDRSRRAVEEASEDDDELEEEEEEEDGEDEMPAQGGAAGLNDFVVESSLSQLMAMGFDKLKCQDALLEAGGDIEAAAEFLFSACV
eukprot:CAMPEP_0177616122 /NCGR_PEP_ID=MMETSP0419_2-20121207/23931_1 /TAXON_ID=582737 /ORGANISM="Tetraselmis sp., Strain GSL018" /LENGTH=160 /DNA_ID=CAMNT_0019114047 /DNA_START=521 /DNA_END=1004 /DNA_ORIENTATION=-